MIIGAIIQARLTSTRFPRKILEKINGIPVLEHVVNRVHLSKTINKVILACPHSPEACLNEEIFIGSEFDVLDRYYQCAKKHDLTVIVRITSDCPLVPPSEIDRVVNRLLERDTHYVYNFPNVPDGWDVEAFTFHGLEKAWNESKSLEDRQHVTAYMKRDESLNPIHLEAPKLSLDTAQDLERIKEYESLDREVYTGDRRDGFICNPLHPIHPQTFHS